VKKTERKEERTGEGGKGRETKEQRKQGAKRRGRKGEGGRERDGQAGTPHGRPGNFSGPSHLCQKGLQAAPALDRKEARKLDNPHYAAGRVKETQGDALGQSLWPATAHRFKLRSIDQAQAVRGSLHSNVT
jgi:hypothetical protein